MRLGSRSWTSADRAGTPRRLPRQRTATQFMSGESVKISPLTGDLTYGLSPTTYAKAPLRTVCRSQRLWSAGLFKLYCGRVLGGSQCMTHLLVFTRYFTQLMPAGVS